jgi:aquaporin Z
MRELWMEFIGTFFLVLVVALTGNPLAIGVTLMVMIYMGGHVSGAHYNPAVTLAVWLRGKLKREMVLPYMGFQVLGAFAGALVFYLLRFRSFMPSPGASVMWWQIGLVEILFTFALCSVVLGVATTKKLEGNHIYGLAIGFTLMAGAYAGGNISGAVYNPAVALGPTIMNLFAGGSAGNLLLYIIFPLIGGWLAAWTFKCLNPKG